MNIAEMIERQALKELMDLIRELTKEETNEHDYTKRQDPIRRDPRS